MFVCQFPVNTRCWVRLCGVTLLLLLLAPPSPLQFVGMLHVLSVHAVILIQGCWRGLDAGHSLNLWHYLPGLSSVSGLPLPTNAAREHA